MDIKEIITTNLKQIINDIYKIDIAKEEIQLEHPNDDKWGDLSCNVSFKVAKVTKQSTIEVAKNLAYGLLKNDIVVKLNSEEVSVFKKIDFQAPGFVNFTYSDYFLLYKALNVDENLKKDSPENNIGLFRGQKVLFEYTDPNPFKVFHIGHLMSNAIGESLSRIYEYLGADVKRVNYQGDVGLHVAKSIWGILKIFDSEKVLLTDLKNKSLKERVTFLGRAYALGASAYGDELQPEAKTQMHELNYLIYIAAQERLVEEESWIPVVDYKKYLQDSKTFDYQVVKELYHLGRQWSLEDFEQLYQELGTKFDSYYFESKVGEYGLDIVNAHISDGVFEKDNGAVIFRGEKVGLHSRVFINSKGLPTYEAKDLGLAFLKYELFKYDKSFIVTANEINEYFKVVLKAMGMFSLELTKKTTHIGHGVLRLTTGKMSSRTGEVLTGVGLIRETKEEIMRIMQEVGSDLDTDKREEIATQLSVGAIKYSILKQGLGKDIIYDKDRAIAITGDTGPYLQYTHARANSLIEKAGTWDFDLQSIKYELSEGKFTVSELERKILRFLLQFDEKVVYAMNNLSPNLVCDYLFELAQRFNTFYNEIPILASLNNERNFRLLLTKRLRDSLKTGLWLLGIVAPDKV
ncbi:arginine--tRNA ligase [candidate division WWE3 bacterium]|nr:arginine--tRNA ligase [candidate division WWE3 bacterium]